MVPLKADLPLSPVCECAFDSKVSRPVTWKVEELNFVPYKVTETQ